MGVRELEQSQRKEVLKKDKTILQIQKDILANIGSAGAAGAWGAIFLRKARPILIRNNWKRMLQNSPFLQSLTSCETCRVAHKVRSSI